MRLAGHVARLGKNLTGILRGSLNERGHFKTTAIEEKIILK
jgi:hypothetical protein